MTAIAERPKTPPSEPKNVLWEQCGLMVRLGACPPRADKQDWSQSSAYHLATTAQSFGILDGASAMKAFYFNKNGDLEMTAPFKADCIWDMFGDAALIPVESECNAEKATALYRRPGWPRPDPKWYTPERAWAEAEKRGLTPDEYFAGYQKFTYTIEEATTEGLFTREQLRSRKGEEYTSTWQQYTKRMLWWALIRVLANKGFPQVRVARDRAISQARAEAISVSPDRFPSLSSPPDEAALAIQQASDEPDDSEDEWEPSEPYREPYSQSSRPDPVTGEIQRTPHQELEDQILSHVQQHPDSSVSKAIVQWASDQSADLGDALEMADIGLLRDFVQQLETEPKQTTLTD